MNDSPRPLGSLFNGTNLPQDAGRSGRGHQNDPQWKSAQSRSTSWMTFLGHLVRDTRLSIRGLIKRPGFALTCVLTFGLGIGFVATLFTIINGIAYRPLPVPEGDQVVSVGMGSEFLNEIRAQQSSLETLAAVLPRSMNLSGEVVASRQAGAVVSADLFRLLRVSPFMGRAFSAADEVPGASRVAVIAERLWQEEFGSDPEVIGREIRIDGKPHLVVGVMRAPFGFPKSESVWVPLAADSSTSGGILVGRLKAGTNAKRAAQELSLIYSRLLAERAEAPRGTTVEVDPFARRGIKGAVRNLLNAILGATFLVLLLACTNVANLFLARGVERSREMAMRSALGASRARLVMQLLTESFVLSVLGAAVGLLIAHFTTQATWAYIKPEADITGGMPYWVSFNVDTGVVVFVGLVALLTSVITGLYPALKSSKLDLNSALKDGGSGGNLRLSRMTKVLVNVQMALSVGLVVAAGLFVTLLLEFNQKRLPYNPETVLSARVTLPDKEKPASSEPGYADQFGQLENRLSALPGVIAVATLESEGLRAASQQIELEGATYSRRSGAPTVLSETVSLGYFDVLQVGPREGRLFSSADTATAPAVAVVDVEFAQRFGEGNSVVGRRFRVASAASDRAWTTIIGVVESTGSLKAGRNSDGATFYRSMSQVPFQEGTILVRGSGISTTYSNSLRQIIASTDREIAVSRVHSIQHIVEMERIGINLPGALLIICGLGALLLATVGVYGVISFSVRSRTRELGVRVALGATRQNILRLIMGEGLKQIAIGLGAGVLIALGISAVLASLFTGFGRSAFDLPIYAAVVALLTSVGCGALYLPARRATKVSPMIALRAE